MIGGRLVEERFEKYVLIDVWILDRRMLAKIGADMLRLGRRMMCCKGEGRDVRLGKGERNVLICRRCSL